MDPPATTPPTNRVGAAADEPVSDRTGAYGLRLGGIADLHERLVVADPSWPEYELVTRQAVPPPPRDRVTDDLAELTTRSGVHVSVDRKAGVMVFTAERPLAAEELVHPHLAAPAAVAGRWLGRESFHAGACATAGATWAVLGRRGCGKSTLLAQLARRECDVVCDDLLVLSDLAPFAGPRSIDLRGDAGERLGADAQLHAGARERHRRLLPPIGPPPTLGGFVVLEWGETLEVESIPPGDRLRMLFEHRAVLLAPTVPAAVLELAALPAWRLRRPKTWDVLEPSVALLLDLVAG